MIMLPTEHPEIYQLFHSGHLIVKTNAGVAPDMKLEQTSQRLQESSGGVIVEASNRKYRMRISF